MASSLVQQKKLAIQLSSSVLGGLRWFFFLVLLVESSTPNSSVEGAVEVLSGTSF